MPLEKKSQASESEREECEEEEEELLWLPHLRERESVVVESFSKRRKKYGFYYKIVTSHLCKKITKMSLVFLTVSEIS
jgi:hypothetical protein